MSIMIIMIIICLQLIRLIGLRTESSWKSEGEEEVDEAQRGGNGDGGGCDGDGGGGGVVVGGDDVCCGDGVGGVGGDGGGGGGDVGDAPLLAIDECADDSDVGNCNNDSDHHDDNFEEKQMITQGLHGCPYESQSEAELEETCLALSSSQVKYCHSHDNLNDQA